MFLKYLLIRVQLLLIPFWIDLCFGKIAFNTKLAPGGKCMTPERKTGNCVYWTKCKSLGQKLSGWEQLGPHLCGFSGFQPRICCPLFTLPNITTPSTNTSSPMINSRTKNTTLEYTALLPEPKTTLSWSLDSNGKPTFLPDNCGYTVFAHNRVYGGQEAEKGSWPWMTAIFRLKASGSRIPICGGALVTSRHIITAAHCVVKRDTITPMNPERLMVRVGAHNLTKDKETNAFDVRVAAIRIHEDYDLRMHTNDIAVLRLRQPIPFTNNTAPVCLPYDSLRDEDLSGQGAFVTGFGMTSAGGNYSDILMEVSFDIQDQEMCKNLYKKDIAITDGHLCAGTLDGSKDSCQGDSGSPLVTIGKGKLYYLVGVVSFGMNFCAPYGHPGVYTRITEYLDWLTSKLAD